MIHQEDIAIAKKYAWKLGAPNYIKQTLLDINAQKDPKK
jgi:hypothetical protein